MNQELNNMEPVASPLPASSTSTGRKQVPLSQLSSPYLEPDLHVPDHTQVQPDQIIPSTGPPSSVAAISFANMFGDSSYPDEGTIRHDFDFEPRRTLAKIKQDMATSHPQTGLDAGSGMNSNTETKLIINAYRSTPLKLGTSLAITCPRGFQDYSEEDHPLKLHGDIYSPLDLIISGAGAALHTFLFSGWIQELVAFTLSTAATTLHSKSSSCFCTDDDHWRYEDLKRETEEGLSTIYPMKRDSRFSVQCLRAKYLFLLLQGALGDLQVTNVEELEANGASLRFANCIVSSLGVFHDESRKAKAIGSWAWNSLLVPLMGKLSEKTALSMNQHHGPVEPSTGRRVAHESGDMSDPSEVSKQRTGTDSIEGHKSSESTHIIDLTDDRRDKSTVLSPLAHVSSKSTQSKRKRSYPGGTVARDAKRSGNPDGSFAKRARLDYFDDDSSQSD